MNLADDLTDGLGYTTALLWSEFRTQQSYGQYIGKGDEDEPFHWLNVDAFKGAGKLYHQKLSGSWGISSLTVPELRLKKEHVATPF